MWQDESYGLPAGYLVPDVDDVAAVVAAVDAARLGAAAEAAVVAVVLRQAQVIHRQHVDVGAGRAAGLQPAHDVRVVVVLPVGRSLACHLARKVRQILRDSCTQQQQHSETKVPHMETSGLELATPSK